MKLTVKTLKGSHFEIRVQPADTVMAVKKNIEDVQGKDNYPCGQQLLIHNGKVLKDETTLSDNAVIEDGFLVVMLSKSKSLGASGGTSIQPSPTSVSANPPEPKTPAQTTIPKPKTSSSDVSTANGPTDIYGQAASNLVGGSGLEETIQQIMAIGGGTWDKETVSHALRAAYNNPERAVDYLYSGIPEPALPVNSTNQAVSGLNAEAETVVGDPAIPSSGAPNSSPFNMFPEEVLSGAGDGAGIGSLDFLRNNPQFQALRSMVQTNPQILQPMLQELGKQNPQLLRLIQEHHAEFLHLINESVDGSEGDLFDNAEQELPHSINVTPAEQDAIERLEAMGFDRALVIEAFFACDCNEELAVNYLLENSADYNEND